MNTFVQNRGKAGSPQMGESAASKTRAQLGAELKLPLKGGTLNRQQSGQQNSAARRQSGTAINHQDGLLQNQRRRSSESQGLGHDRYDTDAESLDTTTHEQSIVKVEDSQAKGEQQCAQNSTDYGGSDDGYSEEHEDYYTIQQWAEYYKLQNVPHEAQVAFLQAQGIKWWDDGNSYPTTTSGPPDGFPDNWNIDEESPSDGIERRSSPSPVRPSVQGPPARQFGQQAIQRNPQVPESKHVVPKTSIFHQGASIRQDQRTTNLAVRGGGQFQANAAPPPISQPPTYSQANREPAPPAKAAPRHVPPIQANASTLQSTRAPIGPPRVQSVVQHKVQPIKPIEPTVPIAHPALILPKEDPNLHHNHITQTPVIEPPPGPVEDYDVQALFEKTYDELKAEDFDTIPRGQLQVLPNDMNQRPLAERLEHVHKSLVAGDQDKFFRSLPTREWEEAGDWFLDQFSNVITRTKEARQKKRKLASGFEDEIEKRYRHVAKRQQHVKDALDKMKAQGEGLVPKSPRPSKSLKKV